MNRFIIIVVFAMFLKPIFPVVDYVVNYDYISKVLCENKEKPELKCNGKCHLMKEISKQIDSEKPIHNDKKSNITLSQILFFQEIKSEEIAQIYFFNKSSIKDNYSNFYFHSGSCSVFRPPIFLI